MYGRVWGTDSLEKGIAGVCGEGRPRERKYLANSYIAARVNVN